ncbi:MAG: hypothetical protein U0168_32160 [Nannocystaceae bacterium]
MLAPIDRAQQRQRAHPRAGAQGQLLRDDPAHRVAHDVGPRDLEVVEQRDRIVGEAADRQRRLAEAAAADAAVIPRDREVVGREPVQLRAPAVADHAHALDHEDRVTLAAALVLQRGAVVGAQGRHSARAPARRLT